MQPTNRIFIDVDTGYSFRLHTSNDASKYHLISEGQHEKIADGCVLNGFYLSMFPIHIKLNTGRVISLDGEQFYNMKEGEVITHKKYPYQNKFTRV